MSAGGFEVATAFLKAMSADSGMGFVIVQHLDPTRESLLAELLQRATKMPVVQIKDGMRVKPNRVHIIVPDKTLLIEDGVLRLVPPKEKRGLRHPIDKFFTALAMILHELATNAVKYGSLSVPKGHVQIEWRIDQDDTGESIALEWVEHGGPAVETPARTGQGTQFIEGSIAHELKGKARIACDPAGLHAALTFPLTAAVQADASRTPETTPA